MAAHFDFSFPWWKKFSPPTNETNKSELFLLDFTSTSPSTLSFTSNLCGVMHHRCDSNEKLNVFGPQKNLSSFLSRPLCGTCKRLAVRRRCNDGDVLLAPDLLEKALFSELITQTDVDYTRHLLAHPMLEGVGIIGRIKTRIKFMVFEFPPSFSFSSPVNDLKPRFISSDSPSTCWGRGETNVSTGASSFCTSSNSLMCVFSSTQL